MKINPQRPAGELGLKFMISDFGMATLKEERYNRYDYVTVWKLGEQGRYFAPECRMGKSVGQSADIWALGCILLEVVSYALLGQEGFEEFSRSTTTTWFKEHGDRKNSAFFEITNGEAHVKSTVLDWIQRLKGHDSWDSTVEGFIDTAMAMIRTGRLMANRNSSNPWTSREIEQQFKKVFGMDNGDLRASPDMNATPDPQLPAQGPLEPQTPPHSRHSGPQSTPDITSTPGSPLSPTGVKIQDRFPSSPTMRQNALGISTASYDHLTDKKLWGPLSKLDTVRMTQAFFFFHTRALLTWILGISHRQL